MQCPKCNYQNAPAAVVCMLCGAELAAATEETMAVKPATPVAGSEEIYLHCFVRDPLRVTKDQPVTIGRVQGNDIVLPAKMVSRRHCRVEWREDSFYAVDLGSSNGTFINDVKADVAPVGPGDEIRIGSFNIQCTETLDSEDGSEEDDASATMVVQAVGDATGFAGKLEEMGLGEIATIVEMTRKTGTLLLYLKAGTAKIYFKEGQIINAEGVGQKGEDAFFAIFAQPEGTWEFEGGTPLVQQVIEIPTTSLLLEAARQVDEMGR